MLSRNKKSPLYRITNYSHAFSLIELMIMVSIILIVSIIGIGAYGRMQRTLLIDLETDKLVARMNMLRDEAKVTARCRGLELAKDKLPREIEAPYVNKETPCGEITRVQEVAIAKEIVLADIRTEGGSQSRLLFLSGPPRGTIFFIPDTAHVTLTLSLKTDTTLRRTILINKTTGTIMKL